MVGKGKGALLFSVLLLIILSSVYLHDKEAFQMAGDTNTNAINEIKARMNENRSIVTLDEQALKHEFSKLRYDYQNFDDELPEEEIIVSNLRELMALVANLKDVSVDQGVADIEHLFKLLKYGYAGYQFFGGDEAFSKAKENMINEVKVHNGSIASNDLNQLIVKHLSFVQDGHFSVGKYPAASYYEYFSSEKYEFLKDAKGHYTVIHGEKYYLLFNDNLTEADLKLSINESGKVVYHLGYLSDSPGLSQTKDITLKSRNSEIKDNLQFSRHSLERNYDQSKIYQYNTIDSNKGEIPVIEIRSMMASSQSQTIELRQFVNHAAIVKNQGLFAIDVRGNGGGSDSYCKDWIKAYTGKATIMDGNISSELWTRTTIKGLEEGIKVHEDESVRNESSRIINEAKNSDTYPGWSAIDVEQQRLDNPNFIIVLMDNGVASSGESFIRLLRSMENVIFVGVNTGGVSLIGDNLLYILPHSKIPMFFGKKLSFNETLENIDGIGFQPDLWVGSSDIMDRVIKFIERYDLERFKKLPSN